MNKLPHNSDSGEPLDPEFVKNRENSVENSVIYYTDLLKFQRGSLAYILAQKEIRRLVNVQIIASRLRQLADDIKVGRIQSETFTSEARKNWEIACALEAAEILENIKPLENFDYKNSLRHFDRFMAELNNLRSGGNVLATVLYLNIMNRLQAIDQGGLTTENLRTEVMSLIQSWRVRQSPLSQKLSDDELIKQIEAVEQTLNTWYPL